MPDEIYNLAAQSHVAVSFEVPEYTGNVDGLGTLRILDVIKSLGKKKLNFIKLELQKCLEVHKKVTRMKKLLLIKSPYAAGKVYAHHITKIYRDAYNLFACNGILFNHESPLRGETFVTKKIIKALVRINIISKKLCILETCIQKEIGDMQKTM